MILTFAIIAAIWFTLVAWTWAVCRTAAKRPPTLPRE